MKVVITGGHLTPAVALIEGLEKRDVEILFFGRKKATEFGKGESLEYKTMSNRGIKFIAITTGRFMVRVNLVYFWSLLKIPIGFVQSFFWLVIYRPIMIFSFGGYVAFPVVLAGRLLGIPVYIHEQTKRLGLTNRLTAKFAKKIFVSFRETKDLERGFYKKMVFSGNLLRASILNKRKRRKPEFMEEEEFDTAKKVILVAGGSLGSHKINMAVLGILEKILKEYNLVHLTGNSHPFYDYEGFKKIRGKLKKDLRNRYFLADNVDLDEFSWILEKTDLIISRAGANTVCEIAYFGIPSILIPLLISAFDEQTENAKVLVKANLALVIQEKDLTSFLLFSKIKEIEKNREKFEKDKKLAREIINKKGVEIVLEEILKDENKKGIKKT